MLPGRFLTESDENKWDLAEDETLPALAAVHVNLISGFLIFPQTNCGNCNPAETLWWGITKTKPVPEHSSTRWFHSDAALLLGWHVSVQLRVWGLTFGWAGLLQVESAPQPSERNINTSQKSRSERKSGRRRGPEHKHKLEWFSFNRRSFYFLLLAPRASSLSFTPFTSPLGEHIFLSVWHNRFQPSSRMSHSLSLFSSSLSSPPFSLSLNIRIIIHPLYFRFFNEPSHIELNQISAHWHSWCWHRSKGNTNRRQIKGRELQAVDVLSLVRSTETKQEAESDMNSSYLFFCTWAGSV